MKNAYKLFLNNVGSIGVVFGTSYTIEDKGFMKMFKVRFNDEIVFSHCCKYVEVFEENTEKDYDMKVYRVKIENL